MRLPPSASDGSEPLAPSATQPFTKTTPQLSPGEQARLAQAMMRRQGLLSVRVAAVFVTLLLGLPLVNLYAPDFAAASVFGFSASWLFLGVLFYPITVLLSIYFVRNSDRIEAEVARAFGERADAGSRDGAGSVNGQEGGAL